MPGNEETYSFKLLNLILAIGGHIDSAFKEMARYPKFSEKKACKEILKRASERKGIIGTGVDAFEDIYGISTRKIKFKCLIEREDVLPFNRNNKENHIPEWWKFYNDLKHDVGYNIQMASLRNARDALAGAFLLNVIHKPAIMRLFPMRVAKSKYRSFYVQYEGEGTFEEKPNVEGLKNILKDTIYPPLYVETALFFFDYEKSKEKKE